MSASTRFVGYRPTRGIEKDRRPLTAISERDLGMKRHWVVFAVDAKPSSLRKALACRLAEIEPVVIVERAVSAARRRGRWPLRARVDGLEYRPFHWPEQVPLLGRVSRELNVRRLRRELDRLCPPGARYVCYDSPSQAACAGRLGEAFAVYLAIDDRTRTVTGAPIPGEEEAERQLLGGVDLIICVSERLAQVLQSRAPAKEPSRFVVIENGFDERLFDPSREYGEPEGLKNVPRPRVLVAGHVSERIDWEGVAGCRRRLPDVHWVFLGPADLGAIDRVAAVGAHFRPPVPLAEVPAWIAHSEVGAIPYRRNAFTRASHPLKALEFLAMGLPTFATRIPSLVQFDRELVFVDEADGASYAAVASRLSSAMRSGSLRSPSPAVRNHSIGRRLELFLSTVEQFAVSRGRQAGKSLAAARGS